MFNLLKNYWPKIKSTIIDLLKFKNKDILYILLGSFLWLYIIRTVVSLILLVLFIFF